MNTIIRLDELYDILSLEPLLSDHSGAIDIGTLSGGEKQRIHLARALYRKNKKVYIFDEPTSNLDALTESNLMHYIHGMGEEKTIIMVTHKLSLVSNFDIILVFDSGKMIECGSHDALMTHNGLYKKLYLLDTLV
jgi:ABC-type multidrug transport system fused ATPase/permease subunit